jgi:hypothetical protein
MSLFDCDDAGYMKEYIGNKIEMGDGMIKMTQPVLLQSFVDEFEVSENCHVNLPAKAGQVLIKGKEEDIMSNQMMTKYRLGVGKLRYLATWSRLDILNTVREVSRHMKAPTEVHYQAMIQIMEYCMLTSKRGRRIEPKEKWDGSKGFEFVVLGKSDSTYNQCPETRKSVTGNTTKVNGEPVITKSIMQEMMKLLVTEAELESAVTNLQDMLFVRQLIESMGLKVRLLMVLCVDNQGVRELVNNWSVGSRTRHAATKAMFLRELKEWGLIVVKYLPGSEMSTNLFMKNLPGMIFEKHAKHYVTLKKPRSSRQGRLRELA